MTGGAGFIGSHLVDRALAAGAKQVVAVDNLVAGSMAHLAHIHSPRFRFVRGDVADVRLMRRLLKEPDFIFHNAASKLVVSYADPLRDCDVNARATLSMLEILRQTRRVPPRLVHASTGSVLGSSSRPMKEDHPKNPTTPYGVSKLAGEQYVLLYGRQFGMPVTVLRYFHVYGPRQRFDGEAGVISIFLGRVLRGLPPVVYSGGNQIRCFTFVGDVVDANLLAASHPRTVGESFNVASRLRISIRELARRVIREYAPRPLKIVAGPKRAGENYHPVPSTAKIEDLGFRARTPFPAGLERTRQWVATELAMRHKGTQ